MKQLKLAVILALAVPMMSSNAGNWESKVSTAQTNSSVNFAARDGRLVIKSLHAESDKVAGVAKIYGRSGTVNTVTTAPASGATTISVANVSAQYVANDLIIYQHSDGTVDYTTVASTNAATAIVLNAAISQAGTAKDKIYELAQLGQYDVGAATVSYIGEAIFATPNDSPLRVLVDSGTNGYVSVAVMTDQ